MSARTDALHHRGTKHTCTNDDCGRRFYDLNKLPTPCPYCGVLHTKPKLFVPTTEWPVKTVSTKSGRHRLVVEPIPEPLAMNSTPVVDEVEEDDSTGGEDDILELEDEEEDDKKASLGSPIADRGDT